MRARGRRTRFVKRQKGEKARGKGRAETPISSTEGCGGKGTAIHLPRVLREMMNLVAGFASGLYLGKMIG